MMNRRTFLSALGLTALGAGVSLSVSAEGTEPVVTIPVEPCPCECSNDEGATWFICNEMGEPYPNEEQRDDEADYSEPSDAPLLPPVTALPNTGSGSTNDQN